MRWNILFRNLCNYRVFRLMIHSKPFAYSELKTFKIPWIFKIQFTKNPGNHNKSRTLAYSESKAYSEHCQTSIMKYFIERICVTWKSKHIQNPAEYHKWRSLLRSLFNYINYLYIANWDAHDIQNFRIFRTQGCQLLMYQQCFRNINLLLHLLLFFKEWATLFSHALVYQPHGS